MQARRLAIGMLFIIAITLIPLPLVGLSVGVAPTQITFEDAFRGTSYQATLFVLNPDPEAARCQLSINGEAADWIAVFSDKERTKPAEILSLDPEENLPVFLTITVPESAPNKGYSAEVDVAMAAVESAASAGNAQVILHASTTININVTGTQRVEGSIQGLLLRDTEVGYPGRALLDVTNEGNVQVEPRLEISLYEDAKEIGKYTIAEEALSPGSKATVAFELPFQDLPSADYVAIVDVYVADLKLDTITQNLSILPKGTLTQSGQLRKLEAEGELYTDRMLTLQAEFLNTGQIESNAQLLAEIYRDDVLISIEKSLDLLVLPGDVENLTAYVTLDEPGRYRAVCSVAFGNKETESLTWEGQVIPAVVAESEAPVSEGPNTTQPSVNYTYVGLLAGALVAAGALVIFRRRAHKRSS